MKKLTLILIAVFAFTFSNNTSAQSEFEQGVIRYVWDAGAGAPFGSKIYKSHPTQGSRSSNGNSNAFFANIGENTVDLTFADRDVATAVANFGGDSRMLSDGFGALSRASFTAGSYNRTSSLGAVAMGFFNSAGQNDGVGPFDGINGGDVGQVAFGWRSIARGNGSVAMGHGSTAQGAFSVAIGNGNMASGEGSVTFGLGTTANAQGGVAIGKNNATTDAAFVIGNGADSGNKSDALVVNTDGSAVFSGDVTVNSDMRLKANIITLGSTLAKLLQIDGKSYVMKSDTSKQKIGLLAQDVQAVYPELVKEANNEQGTLSVNYQGLIPVLINAIKEQQAEIDELKQLIKKD